MKRTRSVMLVAILLLSAMVVFVGTAAGQHTHTISGTITDTHNHPCVGCTVEITPSDGLPVVCCVTNGAGCYTFQRTCSSGQSGGVTYITYKVCACGQCIGTYECHKHNDCTITCLGHCTCCNPIPEFTTIAIPAVALLGLFAFYRRKQKK